MPISPLTPPPTPPASEPLAPSATQNNAQAVLQPARALRFFHFAGVLPQIHGDLRSQCYRCTGLRVCACLLAGRRDEGRDVRGC